MTARRTRALIAAAVIGGPLAGGILLVLFFTQNYVNWNCKVTGAWAREELEDLRDAEAKFHAANGRYTTDLVALGWNRPVIRRYVTGFANPSAAVADPNEIPDRRAGPLAFEDIPADSFWASVGDLPADTFANADAYRAAAVADTDRRADGFDVWVVDQTGVIVHRTQDCDFRWIDELTGK